MLMFLRIIQVVGWVILPLTAVKDHHYYYYYYYFFFFFFYFLLK